MRMPILGSLAILHMPHTTTTMCSFTRFAAVITFGYFAFHLGTLFQLRAIEGLSTKEFLFGKNSLMFNMQDIKDLGASIKWFLERGPRPEYGRWTYWEKFDYMAVFWAVAVIGLSGLIFTIHFFNTHLRPESFPMDTVIFTGHVPLEEYKKDRPREYKELVESGNLDKVVVERDFSSTWMKFVKFFGFLFLGLGVIMIILIVYSLLMGVY